MIKILKNSFSVIIFCLLFGCSVQTIEQNKAGLVFDESIFDQYQMYDKSIISNRLELLFESGKIVQNCAEYFPESESGKISEDINNKIASQEYLICDTLRLLKNSRLNLAKGNAGDIGNSLYEKLDLRTLRSSLSPVLEEDKFHLKGLTDMEFKVGPDSVELIDSEWELGFKVIAFADFDNDGDGEILVWMYDRSLNNTYVDYQVLVIKKKNGRLVAQ